MAAVTDFSDAAEYPIVTDVRGLDRRGGSLTERFIFNHAWAVVFAGLAITVVFALQATQLRLNASFESTVPARHPYLVNYLRHRADLQGLNNTVRIAVETRRGTVFDAAYLETLKRINDEVFLIPGVDRAYMKSLWTPSTRWIGMTEEGFEGGPVVPDDYDGSPHSVQQVRANVERSGEIGQSVALDRKSTILSVPLLERDATSATKINATGIDYKQFSDALERIRAKYQNEDIAIHITGFAKIIGDMIDGLVTLSSFFAATLFIAALVLYAYSRSLRGTLLVVSCSIMAVIWLLGLLATVGTPLDPYSTLVPFLLLASGMSHGAQILNAFSQETARGNHKSAAARYAWRRLFRAGLTAILTDVAAYAALLMIPIAGIRELAWVASLGAAALIFTNLILLLVLLAYVGAGSAAINPAHAKTYVAGGLQRVWRWLEPLTRPRAASVVIVGAVALAIVGAVVNVNLVLGDRDAGAAELQPDSRYNRDNAFMNANYLARSDLLVVMVKTPPGRCTSYPTLNHLDALSWQLQQLPGVASTHSLAALSRQAAVSLNEGNLKWYELPRNQATLNAVAGFAPSTLLNSRCDLLPLHVYLDNHESATLGRVTAAVQAYATRAGTDAAQFLLAAGNAGMAAAVNDTVRAAVVPMVTVTYVAIVALCFIALRSWRAVLCAVLPLVLTAILCQALMVGLDMGLNVSTLPVIVLGIGVGVDYALYILVVVSAQLRNGANFEQAYRTALHATGHIVVLMGMTLSIAVGAWALSPIKFQADMGMLLALVFMLNMLGSLVLVAAFGCFLLRPQWRSVE